MFVSTILFEYEEEVLTTVPLLSFLQLFIVAAKAMEIRIKKSFFIWSFFSFGTLLKYAAKCIKKIILKQICKGIITDYCFSYS